MPKNAIIERGPANDLSFDVMLGRRVRTAREEASMSQEALSGALGFENRQVLSNIESGKRKLGGDEPGRSLPNAIEQRLGVPVLFVDAPQAISGAASKLEDLSVILINRNEPEYRRNYDLAHELFHILTWQAMPPDPLDATEKKSR